ncbi:PAS domain S-box protein [Ramlibacter humi]|uniref:histidine kinase n=1 Tax=Ramlibacter humi TaxID=2530451 RepID=A0A4Z0BEY5_9BURK|nr:PAS domain S-box protein [Ramlibacter humi]
MREGIHAIAAAAHAEDRPYLLAAARRAASTDLTLDYRFRTVAPTRYLRIAGRVVATGEDGLDMPSGMLFDETQHVIAQARLDALAESSPAMLWMMEPDGFCSFYSRSWNEYTGQLPEEALGLGWLRLVHPDDVAMARECAQQAVAQQTFFRIEHRIKHRSGQWRWVMCMGNPRFDPMGNFLGHSGSVTDVHERRLWEQRPRFAVGHV